MNIYLESSAALRDVLGGADADDIRRLVSSADLVTTSRLTLAEVGRVLARLRVLQPVKAAAVAAREAAFVADSELWAILPVDDDVLTRCARPFPVEPVRALDAIHVASFEKLSAAARPLVMVSTDERVRSNARALGFDVRP